MNIFVLDSDLNKAAQYHNDIHLNKMLLEMTQMLCTAAHILNSEIEIPYKPTHKNHPCTKWLTQSFENYLYGIDFAKALIVERQHRKFKQSKCESVIDSCYQNIDKISFDSYELTPFVQAIANSNYKHDDAIVAYRTYHIFDKQGRYIKQRKLTEKYDVKEIKKFYPYRWTNRSKPYWFVTIEQPKYRVTFNDKSVKYFNNLENLNV